jgi:hypothetical protein
MIIVQGGFSCTRILRRMLGNLCNTFSREWARSTCRVACFCRTGMGLGQGREAVRFVLNLLQQEKIHKHYQTTRHVRSGGGLISFINNVSQKLAKIGFRTERVNQREPTLPYLAFCIPCFSSQRRKSVSPIRLKPFSTQIKSTQIRLKFDSTSFHC